MEKLQRAAEKLTAATNVECFYVQADVRQVRHKSLIYGGPYNIVRLPGIAKINNGYDLCCCHTRLIIDGYIFISPIFF